MSGPAAATRADIQGVRALAVVLVVLDHAGVGWLRGGFVGVDVFFVVSGFLITALLLREVDRTGSVSLADFYARRARRILPAAAVVLVATLAMSVALLDGASAVGIGDHAVWVAFFAANVAFARESTDYFAADSPDSPLMHFWSLGVEEQFYLGWPLVVLASVTCLARRAGARRAVALTLVPLTTVSFLWSVHQTGDSPSAAYFSTAVRAWELGAGALVAVLLPGPARLGPGLRAALSWAGLGMVLSAAVLYGPGTPWPGHAALLPCVGTALLLVGGTGELARQAPQPWLTPSPVRWVGDRSYSLYLWHWPLLVVAGHGGREATGWTAATVMVLAVAASAVTYRWVETPFRTAAALTQRRRGRLRSLALYPATVALTLGAVAAAHRVVQATVAPDGPPITLDDYGQQGDGTPVRLDPNPYVALVEASLAAADNGRAVPSGLRPDPLHELADSIPDLGDCDYIKLRDDLRLCPRGDVGAGRRIVLLGDSHARQWVPAVERLAEEHGYEAYFLVRQGCPAADVTPWDVPGGGPNLRCERFQDWAVGQVGALRPELTLVATDANEVGFVDADGSRVRDDESLAQMLVEGLTRQLQRIRADSGRVVVVGDPPGHEVHPAECLTRRDASLAGCVSPPQPRSLQMTAATRRAATVAGVGYLSTALWFCVADRCPTVVGDYVTHRDREHITVPYAEHLAPELGRRLGMDRP